MARDTQIDEPIKVTLYLPSKLTESAKSHAKDVENTSLSRLVAELLTDRMSEGVKRDVVIPPEVDGKLVAEAKKRGLSVEELIVQHLTPKPATKKAATKKPVSKKKTATRKRATSKK